MTGNKLRTVLIGALLATLAVVTALLAAPASARPGKPVAPAPGAGIAGEPRYADECGTPRPYGDMCYFFRSNYKGAQAGFIPGMSDLLEPITWLFPGTLDGAGQRVGNNAGSGHNRDTACKVTISRNPGGGSPSITLERGHSHPTLGVVNNKNRSHEFHDCL